MMGETLSLTPEEASSFGDNVKPVKGQSVAVTQQKTNINKQPATPKRSRFDGWGYPQQGKWLGRGPDAEVRGDLQRTRDRALDVTLDDRFAKRVVGILGENVVGQGIRLQSKIEKQRGEGLDSKLNSLIEEAWEEWLDKQFCHTAGLQHFYELQRLTLSSCVMNGESFTRFVYSP